MKATELVIVWTVIAFILYKFGNVTFAKYRQRSKARRLRCGPIPVYTPGDPFGIYSFYETMKAASESRFPECLVQRVNDVSKRENRPITTFWNTTGGGSSIFTCDPRNIQAVLATQFKEFELGELRNASFRPMLGHGIFASNGKKWEHSRAMLRPQFSRDQINDLNLEEKHVINMIKALQIDSEGWTAAVDLKPFFFRLTIDAATEFLFGESVMSQLGEAVSNDIPNKSLLGRRENRFSSAFDKAQYDIFRSGRMGRMYRLGHTSDLRKNVQEVHDFVDYYVERYVFLNAIAEETQNPIELRDALLNILLAGRDTTASLLSWVMIVLSQNEAIFDRLRQTVLLEFGTYDNPREITFQKLKNCVYLQWTLKETLRLYAVVPINQRAATIDTTIPVGGGPDGEAPVFVPKGTEVYYSVHVMHRSKELWGDDADVFRPERWLGKKYGWDYLPSNGGPRICLDQQFALTEAGYVVVRLLQRFDKVTAAQENKKTGYRMTLTCAPTETP
ncbi:cytochrome P450 [Aspergillus ibericus CBS 121593]|uniref:Putative cytochrome P450 family protein n=1 Tax=Aspergillus ibericus CBS 121593 TaxID=1448316 RepID=A0A395H6X5_9EURO|nr:putative cytochrome P450 family protein [Aspergillus ibericus CBS 121593]RAL03376.1 putative cytochrome P450 family protein [Aspergillus ibericus CBS 121593]